MIKRILPALMLLCLPLAACGTPTPVPASAAPTSSPSGPASTTSSITLSLPAPQAVTAQYVNRVRTTRVDVQIDAGSATSYVLGSEAAPCGSAVCTITLSALSPANHTFRVSTYGIDPGTGTTVLISQGTVTQTLAAGQQTSVALTLAPVTKALSLKSAVQQFNRASRTYGNYVRFVTVNGRSLPAYYDLHARDSVGDVLPDAAAVDAVLCSASKAVVITDISDAAHANRFRVEVQAPGTYTLQVRDGGTCAAGGVVRATQAVSGVSSLGAGLATGLSHGLALLKDHGVRSWGYNFAGQLGDGTTTDRLTPGSVTGLTGVVAVAGGGNHSLALMHDGTVEVWGDNSSGQLGDGTIINRHLPVVIGGLKDVVSLAGGWDHSLALLADGTVVEWGSNTLGQVLNAWLTPKPVADLGGVVSISAGTYFSLALLADGTVRAWGNNYDGQLGNDPMAEGHRITHPISVPSLSGVVSLSAGVSHVLALMTDGTVQAWGLNDSGQLGDRTTTSRFTPRAVTGLTGVVSLSAAGNHSLAALSDGTIRSWGENAYGQVGDGTTVNRLTPVLVGGLERVVSLSAGSWFSTVLLADGTVRAWGLGSSGSLGDGTATGRLTPVTVNGLVDVQVPTP
ncbi:hypothetical protein [Deinococcus sp. AJ005]|uniref:RCC1 domain-containing protein n=1 Tax=Deinococcus sp. AJ005 TaxID=2652443 RepID=UPI0018657A08|nr:hypothetical protein [Deinococcus sp. AJ005]